MPETESITNSFQGEDLAVTAAAQGYVTISGVVGSSAIRVFSGEVLSNTYVALASQQTVPGALLVTGNHQYIIRHTIANVAQTDYEGYKLQFYQLPCNANSVYYESTGL